MTHKSKTTVRFRIRKDFKTWLGMRKWTIADLKEKMGMNSDQQVSQTLSGTIEPSMYFMHKLCEVTGFDLKDLIETERG